MNAIVEHLPTSTDSTMFEGWSFRILDRKDALLAELSDCRAEIEAIDARVKRLGDSVVQARERATDLVGGASPEIKRETMVQQMMRKLRGDAVDDPIETPKDLAAEQIKERRQTAAREALQRLEREVAEELQSIHRDQRVPILQRISHIEARLAVVAAIEARDQLLEAMLDCARKAAAYEVAGKHANRLANAVKLPDVYPHGVSVGEITQPDLCPNFREVRGGEGLLRAGVRWARIEAGLQDGAPRSSLPQPTRLARA
jgi:hypothetical protein